MIRDTFEPNAFSRLVGPRPAFGTGPERDGDDHRQPAPDVDGEFDRSAVMRQLKRALTDIDDALASEQAFARPTPQTREAIEVIVTLGFRLANDDPDFSADVHYVRHADDMANAAKGLKNFSGPRNTARH